MYIRADVKFSLRRALIRASENVFVIARARTPTIPKISF